MDVLSSVLAANQVHGVIWSDGHYRGRWGIAVDNADVAGFHLLIEGEAWLMLPGSPAPGPGQKPRRLLQGDVVVIPNGAAHVIADDPTTTPVPIAEARRLVQRRRPPLQGVRAPGEARMACGAFRFARGTPTALLSVLPGVIHVRANDVEADDLLRTTVRLLVGELGAQAPGSSVLIDRLVDVLFIAVVRRWLATQPEGSGGWLGALRDERIGKVVGLMHAEPHKRWTVEALARKSGLSRAAFARRFQELVGEPPLSWLSSVRVDVARRLLETTDDGVAEVAAAVGYESEFAFSRAFKRATGAAPSHHRGQARAQRPIVDVGAHGPKPLVAGSSGRRLRAV